MKTEKLSCCNNVIYNTTTMNPNGGGYCPALNGKEVSGAPENTVSFQTGTGDTELPAVGGMASGSEEPSHEILNALPVNVLQVKKLYLPESRP